MSKLRDNPKIKPSRYAMIPVALLHDRKFKPEDCIVYGLNYLGVFDGNDFMDNAEIAEIAGISERKVNESQKRLKLFGMVPKV